MLCPFAHPVAWCCVLLGVAARQSETGQTFSCVQIDATTLVMLGVVASVYP